MAEGINHINLIKPISCHGYKAIIILRLVAVYTQAVPEEVQQAYAFVVKYWLEFAPL